MLVKVVGVRKCSGEYQGKKWSHTKLYCLTEDKNVTGYKAEFFKVPDDVSIPAFPSMPCIVSLSFDRFGNVALIEVKKD